MVEKELKTEKVPLLIIYKDGSNLVTEFTDDTKAFEMLGYLRCYLIGLEEDLIRSFKKNKEEK